MDDIHSCSYFCDRPACVKAQRDKLREQLAQQNPVAWMDEKKRIIYWHNTHDVDDYHGFKRTTPLYESPPAQRTWVGLTDEEVEEIYMHEGREDVVLLTQAKLKDKNT